MTSSHQDLIEEGQPLVVSLASRIHRNIPVRVELDDLIAYGEVGLAEAARDFDESHGTRFTTYAFYRIRGAIYDGLSKMAWTSRARYRRLVFQQRANELLASQSTSDRDPAEATLDSEAKWLRDTTDQLAVVYLASQDDQQGGIRDSSIADLAASPAPAIAAQREIIGKLRELVKSLPNAERDLIRSVYFEGATLQEAGRALGISKSWASRLHAKALEQLSRSLRRLGAD